MSVSDHIVQRLAHSLSDANFSRKTPLVVAYSGGVDSTVLLHAVSIFREHFHCPIHAVHVHHGLSANADAWARHCELQCRLYDIDFHLFKVQVDQSARKSIEAEARKVRYKALLEVTRQVDGALLLGQHAEDQLETVLLQLKRGAGPQGLSGMGEFQFRQGTLVLRPMLALQKKEIVAFAQQEALQWVEDESNTQNSFDRNFLRNEVIPGLLSRWPQLTKTVGRSANLCAEQTQLVNETAYTHLKMCMRSPHQLSGSVLDKLSSAWQAMVIRAWFTQNGELVPSKSQTDEILSMLHAKHDATPEVRFKWGKVARFDDDFYWVKKPTCSPVSSMVIPHGEVVELPWLDGGIRISFDSSAIIENSKSDKNIERTKSNAISLKTNVRNLKVKPENAQVSKTLKDWFKVWRIPLWEREKVPVILLEGHPVAMILNNEPVYFLPRVTGLNVEFFSQ